MYNRLVSFSEEGPIKLSYLPQTLPPLLILFPFFNSFYPSTIQASKSLKQKRITLTEIPHENLLFSIKQSFTPMDKTGQCQCGSTIRIPKTESIYECKNCNCKGIFLCHVIPEPSDPVFVRCKECNSTYTMFECPNCSGTAVIKDFSSGHVYGCVCGFNANFISCNFCTSLLLMPPKSNCQNSTIQCKKCSNKFKYRVCQACGQCNYILPQQQSMGNKCFNQKCRLYSANSNVSSNPYIQNSYPEVQQSPQRDLNCKICRNNQSSMINTSCFHLSVCQTCVNQLSLNKCPVCTRQGEYHKVQF